jgi:hypothetical protein
MVTSCHHTICLGKTLYIITVSFILHKGLQLRRALIFSLRTKSYLSALCFKIRMIQKVDE